jgi:sortase B
MSFKLKVLRKVLFVILFIVFGYSTIMIGYRMVDKYHDDKLNKNITQIYNLSKIEQKNPNDYKDEEESTVNYRGQTQDSKLSEEKLTKEDEKAQQLMESLLKINKDIVGWINVKNTRINYPVVQGKDNEYYLHYNTEKKQSRYGSIFIDYRNKNLKDFIDVEKNIVIYGHNMKDETMFGDLKLYKDEKFFKNNQIINFDIFPQQHKWQIFAAYVTDTDFNYIKTDFKNDTEFSEFIKSIRKKSWYINDTIPNSKDVIITLSTCSYEFKDARFVVHFKLIKE